MDSVITLIIERSDRLGMECVIMNTSEWASRRSVAFFPSNTESNPCSLHYKQSGNFIFAHGDREKVVCKGFDYAEVDLGMLNEKWTGCVATLVCK